MSKQITFETERMNNERGGCGYEAYTCETIEEVIADMKNDIASGRWDGIEWDYVTVWNEDESWTLNRDGSWGKDGE